MRPKLIPLWLFCAIAIALAGCLPNALDATFPCTLDKQCGEGWHCTQSLGYCEVNECGTDSDCDLQQRCMQARCLDECSATNRCECVDPLRNEFVAFVPGCNEAVCGDGTVQATEQCDDGNKTSNDGCAADCKFEFLTCDSPSVFPIMASDTPIPIPDGDPSGVLLEFTAPEEVQIVSVLLTLSLQHELPQDLLLQIDSGPAFSLADAAQIEAESPIDEIVFINLDEWLQGKTTSTVQLRISDEAGEDIGQVVAATLNIGYCSPDGPIFCDGTSTETFTATLIPQGMTPLETTMDIPDGVVRTARLEMDLTHPIPAHIEVMLSIGDWSTTANGVEFTDLNNVAPSAFDGRVMLDLDPVLSDRILADGEDLTVSIRDTEVGSTGVLREITFTCGDF